MEHLLGAEKLQRTFKCKHWIKPGATKSVATVGTGSRGGRGTGSAVAPLLLPVLASHRVLLRSTCNWGEGLLLNTLL